MISVKLMVVTGMPGSGKEEFLNAAAGKVPFIRMGDVVRKFHSESNGELGVGEFASAERERHGFDIWARRSIEMMSGDVYIVDGCRSMPEVDAFKGLADVYIVAIHSAPKVRFERLVQRGRDDAPADMDEFVKRDRREMGWGIGEVIILSDIMIVNDGSLEEFRSQSKKVLEMIV